MNYTEKAVENFPTYGNMNTETRMIKYFNQHVGKATQGQVQQIINNLYKDNLNNENIPDEL